MWRSRNIFICHTLKSNIFCLVHIVLMGDFPFTAHAAIFSIFIFCYIKYKDATHNKKNGCIYNYTTRDQTRKSIKQKIVLSLFSLPLLPPPPQHLNGKCNCIQIILTPKTNEGSTNHYWDDEKDSNGDSTKLLLILGFKVHTWIVTNIHSQNKKIYVMCMHLAGLRYYSFLVIVNIII